MSVRESVYVGVDVCVGGVWFHIGRDLSLPVYLACEECLRSV